MNSKKCIAPTLKQLLFLIIFLYSSSFFAFSSTGWYDYFYSLDDLDTRVSRSEQKYTIELSLPDCISEAYFDRFPVFLLIPGEFHSPEIEIQNIKGHWLYSKNFLYENFQYTQGEPFEKDHLNDYSWERVLNRLVNDSEPLNIRGYSVIRLDLRPHMITEPPYHIYAHDITFQLHFEKDEKRVTGLSGTNISPSVENSFLKQAVINPEEVDTYQRSLPVDQPPSMKKGLPDDTSWALRLSHETEGFHFFWGKDILQYAPPSSSLDHFTFHHHNKDIPWTVYPETDHIHQESLVILYIPPEITSPLYLSYSRNFSEENFHSPTENMPFDIVPTRRKHTLSFGPRLNYDPQNGTPYWKEGLRRNHDPFFLKGVDASTSQAEITASLSASRTVQNWEEIQEDSSARIEINEQKSEEYEISFDTNREDISVTFPTDSSLQEGLNILSFQLQLDADPRNADIYLKDLTIEGSFQSFSLYEIDRPRSVPDDLIVLNENRWHVGSKVYQTLYQNTFHDSWLGNDFAGTLYYSLSSQKEEQSRLRSGIWTAQRKFQNFNSGLNFLFLNQYSPEKELFRLFPDGKSAPAQDEIFRTMQPFLDKHSHLMIVSHNLSEIHLGPRGQEFFRKLQLPFPEKEKEHYLAVVNLDEDRRATLLPDKKESVYKFSSFPQQAPLICSPASLKGAFASSVNSVQIEPVHFTSNDFLTQPYEKILVLTPRYFQSSLVKELKSLNINDDVSILPIESIFDYFNHGVKCPKALRNFLTHLAFSSDSPPLHVVLLGNANLDPEGYFQVPNWIPVYPHITGNRTSGEELTFGMPDSSSFFYTIFRLPVSTREELEIFFEKYRQYIQMDFQPHQQRLVFGIDDFFESYARDKSPAQTPDYFIDPVFIKDYPQRINPFFGPDTTRTNTRADSRFIDEINRGAPLIYYTGHGGPILLAHERLMLALRRSDSHMPYLNNAPFYPFFVTYTCYTGKHFLNKPPHDISFGEALLLTPGKGTIASYMPITAGVPREQAHIARIFNYGIFQEQHTNLGNLHWMLVNYYPLIKGDGKLIREHSFYGFPTLDLDIEPASTSELDPRIKIDKEQQQWKIFFEEPKDILSVYSHPLKEISWSQQDEKTIQGKYDDSFLSIFPLQLKTTDNQYFYIDPDPPQAFFQFHKEDEILKNILYEGGKYYLKFKVKNLRLHHRLLGKRGKVQFHDEEGNLKYSRRTRLRQDGTHRINLTSFLEQNESQKIYVSLNFSGFEEYDAVLTLYPPVATDSQLIPMEWNVFTLKDEIDESKGFIRLNAWNWEKSPFEMELEYPHESKIQTAPLRIFQTQFTLKNTFDREKLPQNGSHIIRKNLFLDSLDIEKVSRYPTRVINGDTMYFRYCFYNPTDYHFRNVTAFMEYLETEDEEGRWRRDRRVGPDLTLNIPPRSEKEVVIPTHIAQAVGNINMRLALRYGPLTHTEKKYHEVEILSFPNLSVEKEDFSFHYEHDKERLIIKGKLLSDTALEQEEVAVHIEANNHLFVHRVPFKGTEQEYHFSIPLPPANYTIQIMFNPQLRIPERSRADNSVRYDFKYQAE